MRAVGIFFVLLMTILPIGAFTGDSLDIVVLPNGDAVVTFGYSLSWLDQIAVFLGVIDPAQEMQKAIANNIGKEVVAVNVRMAPGPPYSQSVSNLDDNIIPLPNKTIGTGKGYRLTLGIKQFATVTVGETGSVAKMGEPVPGAEIYILPEPDEELRTYNDKGTAEPMFRFNTPNNYGINDEGIKRLNRGIDDLINGTGDYNSTRKKLIEDMRAEGVPETEIAEIITNIERGIEPVTYSTPEISFAEAEQALKQLWFASFIGTDLSPSVTRIIFPDGRSIEFYEQTDIPQIRCATSRGGFAVSGRSST